MPHRFLRERLGNAIRLQRNDPVLRFQIAARTDPAERRRVEQAAALDHLAPGLGKWRDAEFHAAGDLAAVPGRAGPAAVLFPDAQPRKILLPPLVAESKVRIPVERDEERLGA